MLCPHCGGEHLESAKFCPVTGQALAPALVSCWNCHQPTPAGQGFCAYCGASQKPSSTRWRPVYMFSLVVGISLLLFSGWMLWQGFPPVSGVTVLPTNSPSLVPADALAAAPASPLPVPENIQRTPTSTPPTLPNPTATPAIPTEPSLPNPTATPAIIIEPTLPLPTFSEQRLKAGDLTVNGMDGVELVRVPAGSFLMGADPDSLYFWGAEAPVHAVNLEEFWIYRTEVTNAMYQVCTAQQKCPRPAQIKSNTRQSYYDNPDYADFPVIYVSWKDAAAYCKWAGGRLPSEAEWEKAARGNDGRMFPWGNDSARPEFAHYWGRDTGQVGSFPAGASPYGAYDMAGNVLEWVFDYFQATYYQVSPDENPRGPASGSSRVFRGGAWHHLDDALRAAARASARETFTSNDLGFRCVIEKP